MIGDRALLQDGRAAEAYALALGKAHELGLLGEHPAYALDRLGILEPANRHGSTEILGTSDVLSPTDVRRFSFETSME